jgi:hypothetical protein
VTVIILDYPRHSLDDFDLEVSQIILCIFLLELLLHPQRHFLDGRLGLLVLLVIFKIIEVCLNDLPELTIIFKLD